MSAKPSPAKWSAEATSYHPDRSYKKRIALVYDPTPGGVDNGDGSRSFSMRLPALLVTDWIADREKVAGDLANRLNTFDELLEGLKGVRANLVRLAWEENTLMIEGIDALIAKAEGQS
jgi:hypothetical protein